MIHSTVGEKTQIPHMIISPWVMYEAGSQPIHNSKALEGMSELQKPFIAAIKNGAGLWNLTSNAKVVLATDEDNVIYATNEEELEIELNYKSPSPHPSLRTVETKNNYFCVLDYPRYDGTDPTEFISLVKAYGPIRNSCHFNTRYYNGNSILLHDPEIVLSSDRLWRHNPEIFKQVLQYEAEQNEIMKKRIIANKIRAEQNRTITVNSVNQLSKELAKSLPKTLRLGAKGRGMVGAIERLLGVVFLVNSVFGKNAHRGSPSWAKFIGEWPKARKNALAEFKSEPVLAFCKWLDEECAAKKGRKKIGAAGKSYLELLK